MMRCNGPHGEYLGGEDLQNLHHLYHVHKARAANLDLGLRAECGAEPTSEYASYREALAYFLKAVTVKNANEFFSDIYQRPFNFEDEGSEV